MFRPLEIVVLGLHVLKLFIELFVLFVRSLVFLFVFSDLDTKLLDSLSFVLLCILHIGCLPL